MIDLDGAASKLPWSRRSWPRSACREPWRSYLATLARHLHCFLPSPSYLARPSQDRVVRQIASGGAPERSRLLLELVEKLDAMSLSVAVDEIGMLGDLLAVPWLVELAKGHLPEMGTPYL
jgi:hypothetical protein